MKFSQNSLNEIQARAAEVFSHYGVALQKGGKSYLGLCPFHQDHKPSFAVRLDGAKAGQWKCFACGAKGRDIFSFVAQMEGLNTDSDFPEVVRRAAAACGLSHIIDDTLAVEVAPGATQVSARIEHTAPMHQAPPRYLTAEADAMAAEVEQTGLYKYLCGLWPAVEVAEVMRAYKVGRGHYLTAADGWSMNPAPCKLQGSTFCSAFPSIDGAGNVHAVKIIPYPSTDHHRLKGKMGAQLYWFKPEQNPGAYFGAHLLPLHPDKPVAVVESEKSAIVGTLFAPAYVWVAVAGATNLHPQRSEMAALAGRELHLFPDADKVAEWRALADQLNAAGYSVKFRAEVISLLPPECKLDIADLMIKEKEYEKEWE